MDSAIVPYVNPQEKKPKANRKRRRIDAKEDDDLALKLYTNPWKINKILTQSDLNGLSRLIIPSDQVRTHVLPYMTLENQIKMELPEGIRVKIIDLAETSSNSHELTFKKWPASNSYVLVSNWSEFAESKKLRKDQEIGMIWEKDEQFFYFMVIEKHPRPPPPPPPPLDLVLYARELKLGPPGTSTGLIHNNQNVVIAAKPLQCRPAGHNMASTTATSTSTTVRRPQVRRFVSVPRPM